MASDDEDVPETGAVFTFGKTRFADNLASKFWIRDDPVVQISCGDEHSAIVTAKGKLYTFGSNDWGQLGHGNTKPYTKPSVVKKLKPEKVYLVACGRNHTLVATESGKLYSFGCGSDGQLGLGDSEGCHEPKAIESFDETKFKKLACGSDFSAAVTENGILYTWGGGSDGQNGLGEDAEAPQRLYISGKVVTVGCGYYHMAVVTDDGSLYTCGESTGGKLGLEQSRLDETSQLQKVESIKEKVTTVSCGAEFTVAVTENGHVYSFGQGNQGQLGLGSLQFETEQPEKVQTFNKIKAKSVSCGESFTAIVTKHGNFYTFGDGRHGKLGLGDECFSNLFKPAKVSRFDKFVVNKVSCGGCHMLVTAIRKEGSIEDSDSEDQVEKEQNKTLKQGLMLDAVDGTRDLSATWSARDKRRQKNIEDINRNLSTSLPPVNKSSLPPLNRGLKRTLQNLKTSNPDKEDKTTTNPLNMSLLPKITYPDDEDQKPVTNSPKPLPRGLPKPSPLAPPRALPRAKKEKEESEEEEEEESEDEDEEEDETENEKNRKNKKIQEIKKQVKKQDDEEDEEEDDETESEDETHTKEASKDQRIIKPAQKAEDEEDEEEEESESEEENTNDASKDKKAVKSIAKKSIESEEDDEDEEEDEEAEEDENQNQTKKGRKKNKEESKKAKEKESKDKKIEEVANEKKKSKKDEEDEDEEEEEDDEDDEGDGKKDKTNAKEDEKDKKNKKNKRKNKDDETEDNNIDAETKEKESKGKKGKKKKGEAEEDDKDKENTDDKKDGEKDEEEETNGENKEDKNKDTNKPTTETPAKKDKKSGICVIL